MLDRPARVAVRVARARFLQHVDPAAVLQDTAEAMTALDAGDPAVRPVTLVTALSVRALESWHLGDAASALVLADRAAQLAGSLDPVTIAELTSDELVRAVAERAR